MLCITIKNLLKSKMLTLCLIAGFILSTAIVSALPTYTKSFLNQFLDDTFEKAERVNTNYTYPSMLYTTVNVPYNSSYTNYLSIYSTSNSNFTTLSNKITAPVTAKKVTLIYNNIKYKYLKDDITYYSSASTIESISGFNDHVNIVQGRFSGDTILENNAVEVIVDTKTFNDFGLKVDGEYELINVNQEVPLKVKIVGIYEAKSKDDPYWADRDTNFYCRLMVTERSFLNMLKKNPEYAICLSTIKCETLFDYKKIDDTNAVKILSEAENSVSVIKTRVSKSTGCTLIDNLKIYAQKEPYYVTMMWMFLIPVLLMVFYFVFMVSGFITDADKEQIAVLKSRGAGKFEILRVYLYEGIAISIISLAAGPMLGLLLCRLISYTSGFMQFSGSSNVEIIFDGSVYLYALAAVLLLLLTLLLSVYSEAKKSIVEVRQSKNRYISSIFKFRNIDFVLLAVSIYGYYIYVSNSKLPSLSGGSSGGAPVDPLLYLVSTLFIIGAAMFLLRIYKLVVKLLLVVLKRFNLTSLYLALLNVSRGHLKKNSAMLFVAATVALGIYNINIAKNINISYENTILCQTGTDLIVKGNWERALDTDPRYAGPDMDTGSMYYIYIEPPYSPYSKVEGVEACTKVIRTTDGQILIGSLNINISIMALIPHEFGKIAWFDSTLLKYHWYSYLNAMTEKKDYVLISRGLSQSSNLRKGDAVYYKIGQGLTVRGVICDIVDYWPGYNNLSNRNLLISNFDYMYSHMPKYPYEVWMKKDAGVSDRTVYDSMDREGIVITGYQSLAQEMYDAKKEIFLKGTNAILTLNFFSIMAVTIIGFLIYWILSLKSRSLQFGIYRSLGLSSKGVSMLLILEQTLTLGSSILMGLLLGIITGSLFMPLIKNLWYANKFVLPVKYINYGNEYLQLAVILVIIFIFSLFVLRRYISSLKIHQAIKLGDD